MQTEQAADPVGDAMSQRGAYRNGDDPRPEQTDRNAPAHRARAFGGAHTDDAAGDGVRGADGMPICSVRYKVIAPRSRRILPPTGSLW